MPAALALKFSTQPLLKYLFKLAKVLAKQ